MTTKTVDLEWYCRNRSHGYAGSAQELSPETRKALKERNPDWDTANWGMWVSITSITGQFWVRLTF